MAHDLGLFAAYALLGVALAAPLGRYIALVLDGRMRWLSAVERVVYAMIGADPKEGMTWRRYTGAVVVAGAVGTVAIYALQRLQWALPLNPERLPGVRPDLALNTAVSFATNTNWQNYGGEGTLSYLTQACGLGVQNFLSAPTGWR